ncbi:MAG TPA: RNA methyltransferase [Acidimicrobiales bacterium]|nr:RNA methyltransferase [Acidimicrobiales bacterium]
MQAHRQSYPVAGPSHQEVKRFLDVKRGRTPRGDGDIALEGAWALAIAMKCRVPISTVFVCTGRIRGDEPRTLIEQLRGETTEIFEVSARVLGRMVDRDGPDGVAGIATKRPSSLSDVAVGPASRIVVADRLESVGNLGTVIRSADGAGAAAVISIDSPFRWGHPLLVKASMGTIFSTPVVMTDRGRALEWIRRKSLKVVAADPAAVTSYRSVDYRGSVAIVVGNERKGLDPSWIANADERVSIPMLGNADSLNVGHAAALLLYEALHQQGT